MTRVFNLCVPLPDFISDLSPRLAREAMNQVSNALRTHRLHMVISFSTATGFTGTVGMLIWSKEPTDHDLFLEAQRRNDWVLRIGRRLSKFNRTEDIFSCTAIIISITASVIFFSNFLAYRSLKRFQFLYFSKLEKIATTH